MLTHFARSAWISAAVALFSVLPLRILPAQHRRPSSFAAVASQETAGRTLPLLSAPPRPAAALDPENRSLVVFIGALLGACVGGTVYRHAVAGLNDGDFTAPVSAIIYVGGGAAIGAGLAWLFLPHDDPKPARSNDDRFHDRSAKPSARHSPG